MRSFGKSEDDMKNYLGHIKYVYQNSLMEK